MYFEAHPEEVQFIMIPDMNTAIAALKQGKIDVMRRISLREFVEVLPKKPMITENFEFLSPAKFSYDYIGFNCKSEILKDKDLRVALSQMVNVEQVIDKLCYGLAERTVGFIHPAKKSFYNGDLELHQFNLEKLNKDLDSLGWSEKNSAGIRQKIIDSEKKTLILTHIFPSSSLPRKNHAIVLKDYASKVGIELNIVGLETSIFLQRLSQRDFDMYQSGWITGPGESDPKQIWHTSSIEFGSNYVGYGSAYSDSIIDVLRTTMDYDKRAQLYRDLQKDIYEQAPYVFMMCVNERLLISNKFSNIYGTAVRPGFWTASLRRNWLKN
jgi:ABC-type transport system substrate-binding protein